MRVGVHTSIAGAIENAAHHARKIGCDTFQMFSANPRGWRTLDPPEDACKRFCSARRKYGLSPVVIHDSYLINLASTVAAIRKKSIQAFRGELRRALALGADFLVMHPGSAKGSSTQKAVATCVESLKQAAKGMSLNGLMILIENTAGQGSVIGRSFEEVAAIVRGAEKGLPVGACIDTAHTFEAGYPIHTPDGLEETVAQIEVTIGLERVKLIHANDSKTDFGSHADRHQHIGKGKIGREAFGRIVRHPKLRSIPFICETPVDRPGDDKRNLRVMRMLAGAKSNGRH